MGRTESIVLQKKPPPQWTSNSNPSTARKLAKKDLASVIFGCKHSTFKECISKQLFGLPAAHIVYVQNVTPGMPLFLFNCSDRKLHGIFEAVSYGKMEIDRHAWTSCDQESTTFPAQVRVKIKMQCQALTENQFYPIIQNNYRSHEPNIFQFELDRAQTDKLIALFSASPAKWGILPRQPSASFPRTNNCFLETAKSKLSLRPSKNSTGSDKGKQTLGTPSDQVVSHQGNVPGKSWSSLFKPQPESTSTKETSKKTALEVDIPCENKYDMFWESLSDELSPAGADDAFEELCQEPSLENAGQVSTFIPTSEFSNCPGKADELAFLALATEISNGEDTKIAVSDEHFVESNMEWVVSSIVSDFDSHIELVKAPSDAAFNLEGHACSEGSNLSSMSGVVDLGDNAAGDAQLHDAAAAEAADLYEEMISDMKSSDLEMVLSKLIQTIGEMKSFQLSQAYQIQNLEKELVESNRKIEELRHNCLTSGLSTSSLASGHVNDTRFQKKFQDCNQSILLVGGFNGSSWLPDLDFYLPSQDVMQSLEPMSSVRSYASAVILNGGLYVIGGGCGTSWYKTVECYDLKSRRWGSCPSLNRSKGSFAGACLNEKIFAIGGGNATESFSEVEMLDLDMGKWIYTRPMVQKRFAPAAAQMNGVLYVVGGYDGQEYLKSMERFDPRECSWTTMSSMNSRRGCHSVTILNDKLYAIGGYNGSEIVPTVEVFEPRVGSWMMSEPMNYSRGYMGTATLGNKIFVIGGMQGNDDILDTVECYSEGEGGWQLTGLNSVGRRCFFSAVAV